MVVALVSPGQGAQKPGFLTPWLELPGVREKLSWWSQLAQVDLVELGSKADADAIRRTDATQPLLAAAALIAAAELPLGDVTITAGHSIGELPAAAIAGALSADTAIALAGARGREMAKACELAETSMIAVVGGQADEVLTAIQAAGATAANRNSPGQVVAAGPIAALEKLKANPPAKARLIPLQVAGAFHTDAMITAQTALSEFASALEVSTPQKILLSNADGAAVTSGKDTINRLIAQVTSSVRWDLCQETMKDLGVTALIELPPAGTLVGLAKRTMPGVEVLSINTPDDLILARDLIARHGVHPTGEPSVQFSVATASVKGHFAPLAELNEGDAVAAGDTIGHIDTRQGPVPVTAPTKGVLVEWVAHPRDPVAPGHTLARLTPGGAA
ncbi:MAG: acyltransferase domain-containing protein [Corynebacteriales bacterium]|nr:acyltransferase domain-containing protein [Mycobacteriales bacterium]